MANAELLTRLPIPAANVHRIPAEIADARAAAGRYEETLRSFFGLAAGELPRFDLVLLGMGPDGHTASLFPGTPALDEEHQLVVGQWVQALETWRITLSPPVLNNAVDVFFLVAGEDKAAALREVLEGPRHPSIYPSQLVRPTSGNLHWLVDRAAARLLK
jgi:6-phosphogluconolactonase